MAESSRIAAVSLPAPAAAPSRALVAALILLAREMLPQWPAWPATTTAVLSLVGAGKSQAYTMLNRLRQFVPSLVGSPGRPVTLTDDRQMQAVLEAVRDYLCDHPGCVCGPRKRRTYSDGFRRFVVGLQAEGAPGEGLTIGELADAVAVPVGTLKQWMNVTGEAESSERVDPPPQEPSLLECIRGTHARLIVALWPHWEGSFLDFCEMLRNEYRVPHGATYVGTLLQKTGQRQRRRQTAVEAPWSSSTFRYLFPGAQWLGDGTAVSILWGERKYLFNLEMLIDAAADAITGFTISDTEDEAALLLAYESGLETTTGVPPMATTLDNRPSNHSPRALEGMTGTCVLRSTPGRGQSKAPIEGGFGLFKQALPDLAVTGATPREMARKALHLIVTAWSIGRNGKPRKRLKGSTPAQAYLSAHPTKAEIEVAREWIRELQRRNELQQRTREARLDPVRRHLLETGLARLGIADPGNRLAIALAFYSREAIMRGLATFQAKQELGTLPADLVNCGAYLGGIIRQLDTKIELELIALHLLDERRRFRDFTIEPLRRALDQVRKSVHTSSLPQALLDKALESQTMVDTQFWGRAAANAFRQISDKEKISQYHVLSRRVAASFRTDRRHREALIDQLAEASAPP